LPSGEPKSLLAALAQVVNELLISRSQVRVLPGALAATTQQTLHASGTRSAKVGQHREARNPATTLTCAATRSAAGHPAGVVGGRGRHGPGPTPRTHVPPSAHNLKSRDSGLTWSCARRRPPARTGKSREFRGNARRPWARVSGACATGGRRVPPTPGTGPTIRAMERFELIRDVRPSMRQPIGATLSGRGRMVWRGRPRDREPGS
jgi:hypothetical protein